MDEVTRLLQNSGHEVRMFRQISEDSLPVYGPRSTYPVTTYFMDGVFGKYQKRFLAGKNDFRSVFEYYTELSHQCNLTLHQYNLLNFLKAEGYDLVVLEAFNPCSFLVAEKLGLPYIAFYPENFSNGAHLWLLNHHSYVHIFEARITDDMDFLTRLKNTFKHFTFYVLDSFKHSAFTKNIEEHFLADSRPSLYDLYMKAELWIYNVDFTLELVNPPLPNIQYIGGLLAKPAKPLSPDLEQFIAEAGDSGFIVVSLGSMVSSPPLLEFLKEMNEGFTKIPQKVIWRFESSQWPKDLIIPSNVRIMDWLPQNDLLGHEKVQLLVTHGGLNSLMEAAYHGVPVVGIPIYVDQYENMVQIEAKNMGKVVPPNQLKERRFAKTMQDVMEDGSYKNSSMQQSAIRRSHPQPADQKLVRWVEHIIQSGGGGHLRPYFYPRPWFQQHLLDVINYIAAFLL